MNTLLDCEICPILDHPDETERLLRIAEGEHWVATLRQDQEYLGTAFVTLRTHKESLEELTIQEELEFIDIRNALTTAQKRAFGARVINISCLMNNAFQNPDPAPHVHYHMKPRYQTPVQFAGVTFTDRQFGHYIKDKYPHIVPTEVAVQIANALQSEMRQAT